MTLKKDFPKVEFFGPKDCGPLGETLMACIFKGYREGQAVIVTEAPTGGYPFRTVVDDIHVVACPEETHVRALCAPQIKQFVEKHADKTSVAGERMFEEHNVPVPLRLVG